MKLTVEIDALRKAVAHVMRCAARNETIPATAAILMRAEAGRLTLTTNNLDASASISLDADVEQPGAFGAPARLVERIAQGAASGAMLAIDPVDESRVAMRASRSRFTVPTLPETDFPELAQRGEAVEVDINAAALRHMIDATVYAASTDESRYCLNGVYLHAAKSETAYRLRAVAIDGHRAAWIDGPDVDGETPGIIVPTKAAIEIARMCKTGGAARLSISAELLRVTLGEAVFICKLIGATYPDYNRTIPTNWQAEASVDRAEFIAAIKNADIADDEKSRPVALEFEAGKLLVRSASGHGAAAKIETDATYDAAPLTIGFNAKYLTDAAESVDSEMLRISLVDAGSPARLYALREDSPQTIIMPQRVRS